MCGTCRCVVRSVGEVFGAGNDQAKSGRNADASGQTPMDRTPHKTSQMAGPWGMLGNRVLARARGRNRFGGQAMGAGFPALPAWCTSAGRSGGSFLVVITRTWWDPQAANTTEGSTYPPHASLFSRLFLGPDPSVGAQSWPGGHNGSPPNAVAYVVPQKIRPPANDPAVCGSATGDFPSPKISVGRGWFANVTVGGEAGRGGGAGENSACTGARGRGARRK